jgi:hypothetical protein
LAAWSGPDNATLVVYRTLPIPAATPKALQREIEGRLGSLPEARIAFHGVAMIGPNTVARVDIVAPGTGGELAASGLGVPIAPKGRALVPTRRVVLAIPRESDTIWVACHYPESSAAPPNIEEITKGMRVDRIGVSYSSY